jgi:hypothetical protein
VNRHLVTVKVSVVRVTDKWVDLDRLTVYEDWLEGLNPESVKGRRPVEQDRMLLNDFFEAIPNGWVHSVNHPLCRLDILRDLLFDQALHHEWLKEFESHFLWQAALVQLKVRTDDDNGSSGIVNSLTEKVLSETTFLTLEHVAQGLEWSLV